MKIKKRILSLIMICVFCFSVTACGPSEEKVLQAQQKYTELIEKHNQVVEAHNQVSDNAYDEQLLALREKITEVEAYNLNDMEDEEIDLLIQIMDSLIGTYDEFHVALTQVKEQEDAAIIVTIPVTVVNNTGKAISALKLYEQGNQELQVNVLQNLTPLEDGQTMTGLMIQRDAENTAWVLAIECTPGTDEAKSDNAKKGAEEEKVQDGKTELILPVEEYTEEGIELNLAYDEELSTIVLSEPEEVIEEATEEAAGEAANEETTNKEAQAQ